LDFTRQGGSVLFALSDAEAAQGFAGSTLEEMLPVHFQPQERASREDAISREFQERMRQTRGGSNGAAERDFAAGQADRKLDDPTLPFAFSGQTPLADLLRSAQTGQIVPEYQSAAHIYDAKPAAQVLAVAGGNSSEPRPILLATQPFGYGRSAVLATDLLWRWSLKQPSTSTNVETFWQQFVLWLAQPGRRGIRFLEASPEASTRQPAHLVISGMPDPAKAALTAKAPSGKSVSIPLASRSDSALTGEFLPDETGEWLIKAESPAGGLAEKFIRVAEKPLTGETHIQATDRTTLAQIAAATGGKIYDRHAAPFREPAAGAAPLILSQNSRLLWNSWLVFLPLLSLFGAELLLRRYWKLL
ncbi:MAG TPA: hypothetical protein VIS74_00980, partial [Chthoniobacterales bacterium]